MYNNPEARSARICLLFLAAGLLLALFPLLAPDELGDWGYASMAMGFLVAAASLGSFLVVNPRGKLRGRMLAGEGVLARWILDSEVRGKEQAEAEENGRNAVMASRIVAALLFLIGLVLFLADPEGNLLFLGLMVVIALILAVVAGVYSSGRVKGMFGKGAEVVFSLDGILWRGDLYNWDGGIRRLECVLASEGHVVVVYEQRRGRSVYRGHHVLRIPIPRGREVEAERVVEAYGKPPGGEVLSYLKGIGSRYD